MDAPELYFHPFASFCQKVLVALYERGIPFAPHVIDLADPQDRATLGALWPLARFPVLRDGGEVVAESTTIIEHLDLTRPGPPPLTREGATGIRIRFLDRVFDNWVQARMQEVVTNALMPGAEDSPSRVARGRADLDTVYAWLDRELAGPWAAGDDFTLADCAAAPALFYADWVHPSRRRMPGCAATSAASSPAPPSRGWSRRRGPSATCIRSGPARRIIEGPSARRPQPA